MAIFEIYPSSTALVPKRDKHQFPWELLECGQSFSVPKNYIKAETLRPMCSNKGRQLKRKFVMTVHDEVYEVGRVK